MSDKNQLSDIAESIGVTTEERDSEKDNKLLEEEFEMRNTEEYGGGWDNNH